ncbi:MAG: DUF4013 domain-containing protein [Aggregatilineales bacterium]
MYITRAFNQIFADDQSINKLLMSAIVAFAAVLTTPFLIGLAGWALIFGYQVEVIRLMRLRRGSPLPRWDDMGKYLSEGSVVLAAYIVYALPNILIGGCSWLLLSLTGDTSIVSGGVALGIACCVFPLLLAYNLFALPTFTLGMGLYARDPRIGVFFQLGTLVSLLRPNLDATLQWWVAVLISIVLFAFLGVIPCIGWLAIAAIAPPLQGILAGMFCRQVLP